MNQKELHEILRSVADGTLSADDAVLKIKQEPFEDIGYAKPDFHRGIVQGNGEVIYGAGKTAEQIAGILKSLREHGQENILVTRVSQEKADALAELTNVRYYPQGKIAIAGNIQPPDTDGTVLVITAGTSDIPVAEEAAITAEFFGNKVERLYDVGVAGIHRLLSHTEDIMKANVIVAIAGMEGALASVVGGMADCPVIAVPTSVGYGCAFHGVTALLSMLNSCASGVSVVNIDNGFGAGYLAGRINHMNTGEKR